MTQTPLDLAHAEMEATGDEIDRLRFYDRLATAELFLLLAAEAEGDKIMPRLFPVEGADVALIFDAEERLSELAGAVPYAVMTGRQLVRLLAGQGIGLGLNLGVAPSSFLLDAEGVEWLAETLSHRPETVSAHPEEVFAPAGLPEALLLNLDAKLAACAGLAQCAYLGGVRYKDNTSSHILAFVGAVEDARDALVEAAGEALAFSGVEAGFLDVVFVEATDPISASLARCAVRFDIAQPKPAPQQVTPGSDPANPPRLR